MPSEKTHADSIRLYLTGAASDGGAQSSDNAALGNYRSSTEVQVLGNTITSPIANVTINYVAGANGTGAGSLAATGVDTLAWTPPGGTQGAAVTILNGETKILEGGSDSNKYIRVTRTSATNLTGTATVTIANVFNNAVGFDNVSSAEAAAGDNEYRGICVKNENAVTTSAVTVYIATLGTQRTSDTTQLSGAGAGSIATTGSFADWPDTGFAHVKSNVGVTKEIVYYSSRTNTTLTVPAAGRGLLGTSATAGASTDTVDAVPGIRIGKEAPTGSTTAGNAQTIANEGAAPSGITWNTSTTAASGVVIGDLATGGIYFLWIHRAVPAGEVATPVAINKLKLNFDAA
jgi:hypothetical protein